MIQFDLSTRATLGTEEGGHCREVETRVNVWTVHQKKGRCIEVAVIISRGGWTVQSIVNIVRGEG